MTPDSPDFQTRRSFIKKTATVAAGAAALGATNIFKTPVYGQTQAPSPGRVIGANDRIVVGFVGAGSQGRTHIRSQKEHASENNITIAAVSDLFTKNLERGQKDAGIDSANCYKDYEKLLERKDIDAITVATVDNWHAQVAIDAMNAGKHVYGEKPMARYLMEGFDMFDTQKKTGKTFVIGSQYCADEQWHKAAEWIKAGKIGPLVWAQGGYFRNNPKNDEWEHAIDPALSESTLDWVKWQGKAKKLPFEARRFASWHKYFTYNSGILGNLLSHLALPLLMSTGSPEFPRRVVCTGTKKISTDREIPDTTHLLAEYPSGLTLTIGGSTVNEFGVPQIIRGRKGNITISNSANKAELKPEKLFAEDIEAEQFSNPNPIARIDKLEKHFFECVRTGKIPLANIDLALKVHTTLCLAEMSERMQMTMLFDDKTRKITTGDGREIPALTYDTEIAPHA
jgi:predicted dehydrogenase